jgi:dihydroorotate dehydrogenase (fumarate)
MKDISSSYLGLPISSPFVVGACNLSKELDNLKEAEAAGAGAVVFKSIFEEQIQLESAQLQDDLEEYNERHPEMITLFPHIEHAGPKEHLTSVKKAKENLSIPLIASLNAIYKETWVEYAELLADTGIDALELNFYSVPKASDVNGDDIINQQIDILKAVKKAVRIPVSVKLSPFYANPLNVIKQMDDAGADGFVFFNRLFQPDINPDDESHFSPFDLTAPSEIGVPLRFTGLAYDQIKADLIGSTGVYQAKDAVKLLLAGANNIQVVSTLYKNKINHIKKLNADLNQWMEEKGYNKLSDFRGKLSAKNTTDPYIYKRAQYIELILKSNEILNTYPLH